MPLVEWGAGNGAFSTEPFETAQFPVRFIDFEFNPSPGASGYCR